MQNEEKKKLLNSLTFPALFILLLWLIKFLENLLHFDLGFLGILPLQAKGLIGVVTAPLIHADYGHLASNSVPLLVLGSALFFFYRKFAFKVIMLSWLMTGIWVWLFARGFSYHIGASGVVYALASFHLLSGFIRREPKLMAFSLLVIFLYGSMIWGVFPEFFPHKNISWESHLMGSISGIVLAIYYHNEGLQRKEWVWDDEDEVDEVTEEIAKEGENTSNQTKEKPEQPFVNIKYEYKPFSISSIQKAVGGKQ